jgi:hypothetical protein
MLARFVSLNIRLLALLLLCGCSTHDTDSIPQATASNTSSSSTKANPSKIELVDLNGNSVELWQKDAVATVAIFVRSDCPISNRFAPEIRRLYEAYHSRGVNFSLVYVDPDQKSDEIRRHLAEYNYPCPGLRDPKHTLVALCKATVTPEAAVFDKDRRITYVGRVNDLYQSLGKSRLEPTQFDLEQAIESTLAGKIVEPARVKAIGCPITDLHN